MTAGQRVAIIGERSPALIWAMLGVTRLGAVFVVLDAAYPEQRLVDLFTRCAASAVIADCGGAAAPIAQSLAAGRAIPLVDARSALDDPDVPGLDAADATAPAYVLFTSGSTGEPKAVVCSHGPLSHFVAWQAAHYGLDAADRFTMLSGLSHDPVLRDIFTPLSLGGTVTIPSQATILAPGGLRAWFARERPTVAHMTPPMGQLLTEARGAAPLPSLRRIFWGGDLLRPALLERVDGAAPNVRHTNFYGSTETPQAAAAFDLDVHQDWKTVPIGRGIDGFQVAVLDPCQHQKGVDELGEIAIRSPYLSLGYLGSGGDLSPSADQAGIYRTGDRGFHLPNGDVVTIGRNDDQVKIRGYRVDLSEVTVAASRCASVDSAIALAVGAETDRHIELFVATGLAEADVRREVSAALVDRLPNYMLPQRIHVVAALPMLPNGKIDRRALVARAETAASEVTPPTRLTENAALLADAWARLLPGRRVDGNTTFVELGGDSLSYVQVYLATEEVLGVVPDGWQTIPLSELAGSSSEASRWWSKVDTTIMIRAVSIFLIVCAHFHLLPYFAGATTALFLVSGYILGEFQLNSAFQVKSGRPVLDMLVKLMIPLVLFSVILYSVKILAGQSVNPSLLLFYGNFFDYSGNNRQGNVFYLWYIHCALQIIVLTWASLALLKALNGFRIGLFPFALTVFGVACLARFILPGLFVEDFFTRGLQPLTMFNFLPTTHWATFALGALIALSSTKPQVRLTLGLILAYTALSAHLIGTTAWLYVLVFGTLVLFVKRLPLPRPLSRIVFSLAGASLFIYLTHFQWRGAIEMLQLPDSPLLNVLVALLGGIALWHGWQWLTAQIAQYRGRRGAATLAPDEAII